ncbi:MAG TPA: IclR family transcriptional regulator [Phycisphaerae bacterium]|nr:IclR family transcriptional regulator [Phycisphaerae bacterium]
MRASAVNHALRILDLLEEHPSLRFGDLYDLIDTSEPTLAAILKKLTQAGILQNGSDGYRLGTRLLSLATRILDRMDVRAIARKHLSRLRRDTGETIELCIPDGLGSLVVDKFEGSQPLALHARVGVRLTNLHAMAQGKIVLAFLSRSQREEFYASDILSKGTKNTIHDPVKLEKMLPRIRRTKTAIDIEEVGMGFMRIAAAIMDHKGQLAGLISIPAQVDRVGPQRRAELRKILAVIGETISRELGYDKSYEQ